MGYAAKVAGFSLHAGSIRKIKSMRKINAMYYPLCQLYLRLVARVPNGEFSKVSEVVVVKIGN